MKNITCRVCGKPVIQKKRPRGICYSEVPGKRSLCEIEDKKAYQKAKEREYHLPTPLNCKPKKRCCLKCAGIFTSEGNRVCDPCQSTNQRVFHRPKNTSTGMYTPTLYKNIMESLELSEKELELS